MFYADESDSIIISVRDQTWSSINVFHSKSKKCLNFRKNGLLQENQKNIPSNLKPVSDHAYCKILIF